LDKNSVQHQIRNERVTLLDQIFNIGKNKKIIKQKQEKNKEP
jgi:hypothetical protein